MLEMVNRRGERAARILIGCLSNLAVPATRSDVGIFQSWKGMRQAFSSNVESVWKNDPFGEMFGTGDRAALRDGNLLSRLG